MSGTPPVLSEQIASLEQEYIDMYTVAPSAEPLNPKYTDRAGGLIGDRVPKTLAEYWERLLELDRSNVANAWGDQLSTRLLLFAESMSKFEKALQKWIWIALPEDTDAHHPEVRHWQNAMRQTS